jgi:hypothetical protein
MYVTVTHAPPYLLRSLDSIKDEREEEEVREVNQDEQ